MRDREEFRAESRQGMPIVFAKFLSVPHFPGLRQTFSSLPAGELTY
jgi:hypothetical protein